MNGTSSAIAQGLLEAASLLACSYCVRAVGALATGALIRISQEVVTALSDPTIKSVAVSASPNHHAIAYR